MSYIALYRKYRPSTFNEVIGQEPIIKTLKNSIKFGKISHAFLFSGPRGTGKTSVAKIFAKTVNCIDPKDGERCGKCTICKAIAENDIDIIEIDAASNNGVDEIREIRSNVKLVPTIGKYKIYIIDEVHMLSTGAFNALLKTLEEPPEHVIFILATTEIQKIPLTIISRCQRFDFKKVTINSLCSLLNSIVKQEKKVCSQAVINLIAQTCDGGVRDAVILLDHLLSNCSEEPNENDIYALNGSIPEVELEQLFVKVNERNIPEVLSKINDFYEQGKNLYAISERLILLVKNININNNVKNYFNDDICENLEKFKNISNEKTNLIANKLIDMLNELKKATNQKIILEITLLDIMENLKESESLPQIEEKLEINNDNEQPVDDEIISREIISIRINNTLAEAEKQFLDEYKSKLILDEYITNKKYNKIVNILMLGSLIVASKSHIMFEYKNESDLVLFYKNIEMIEKLINEMFSNKCKVVAVSQIEWNKIKKEYVQNKKNGIIYKLQEEPKINVKKESIKQTSKAIDIFGEESIDIK